MVFEIRGLQVVPGNRYHSRLVNAPFAGRKRDNPKLAGMYTTERDPSAYRVSYRSYLLGSLLLLIPPMLLFELGGELLEGSLENSELAGLAFGLLLPLFGAWYLIEFASFRFSRDDGLLRWQWRNLWRREEGEVELERIAGIRREAMDSSNSGGVAYIYRLIVELDDGRVIPLTRSFSGLHDRRLDEIVAQIREYLGHVVTPR
jgi:hypothetical protein